MARRREGTAQSSKSGILTTRAPKTLTPLDAPPPPLPSDLHPEHIDRTSKGTFVCGPTNKGRPGGNPSFGTTFRGGSPGRTPKTLDTRAHLRRRMSLDPDDPCLKVPWTVGDKIAMKSLQELETLSGMDALRGMEIVNRDAYGTQVVIEQGETLAGRDARQESEALLAEAEALRRQLSGS